SGPRLARLSDQVLDGERPVREISTILDDGLLIQLAMRRRDRRGNFMVDAVRREQLLHQHKIVVVPGILVEAPEDRLILRFCHHRLLIWLLGGWPRGSQLQAQTTAGLMQTNYWCRPRSE